jgi:uncharacterized membrane protein
MRPAVDVRTLGLVEVLFSYLVSRQFFKERMSHRELAGLMLVMVGVVAVCAQLLGALPGVVACWQQALGP